MKPVIHYEIQITQNCLFLWVMFIEYHLPGCSEMVQIHLCQAADNTI